jgi:hypothetical protein
MKEQRAVMSTVRFSSAAFATEAFRSILFLFMHTCEEVSTGRKTRSNGEGGKIQTTGGSPYVIDENTYEDHKS